MSATHVMTVEEFLRLDDPPGGRYELHDGVPVVVARPKKQHSDIAANILQALWPDLGSKGYWRGEFPFQVGGTNLRVADIAFVSKKRWDTVPDDAFLQGAPELVVEVLSRSNTATEIANKKTLCLRNGCQEFWAVYPKQRMIEVTTPDFVTRQYELGNSITLTIVPNTSFPVAKAFTSSL